MAFVLNELLDDVKPSSLTFDDGNVLNFKYRPNYYTPAHEEAVAEASVTNKWGPLFCAMLLPLVVEWDVVNRVQKKDPETGEPVFDKKGKPVMVDEPVPLTPEGIGTVPIGILNRIMYKVTEEMTPGEETASSSEGSFS